MPSRRTGRGGRRRRVRTRLRTLARTSPFISAACSPVPPTTLTYTPSGPAATVASDCSGSSGVAPSLSAFATTRSTRTEKSATGKCSAWSTSVGTNSATRSPARGWAVAVASRSMLSKLIRPCEPWRRRRLGVVAEQPSTASDPIGGRTRAVDLRLQVGGHRRVTVDQELRLLLDHGGDQGQPLVHVTAFELGLAQQFIQRSGRHRHQLLDELRLRP